MLSRVIERLKTDSNKVLLGEAYYDMSEYYSGDSCMKQCFSVLDICNWR